MAESQTFQLIVETLGNTQGIDQVQAAQQRLAAGSGELVNAQHAASAAVAQTEQSVEKLKQRLLDLNDAFKAGATGQRVTNEMAALTEQIKAHEASLPSVGNSPQSGSGDSEQKASAAAGRVTGLLSTLNTNAFSELRAATRAIHFLEHELENIGGPAAKSAIEQLNSQIQNSFKQTFEILTGLRIDQVVTSITEAIRLETKAMAEAHGPIEGYIKIHDSIKTAIENVKTALENEATQAKKTAIEMKGAIDAFDTVNKDAAKGLEERLKAQEEAVQNSTATEKEKAEQLLKIHADYLADKQLQNVDAAVKEQMANDAALEAAKKHAENLGQVESDQRAKNAAINKALLAERQAQDAAQRKKAADEKINNADFVPDGAGGGVYQVSIEEKNAAVIADKAARDAAAKAKAAAAVLPNEDAARLKEANVFNAKGEFDEEATKKRQQELFKQQEQAQKAAEAEAKKAREQLEIAQTTHAVEETRIKEKVNASSIEQQAAQKKLDQERLNASGLPSDQSPDSVEWQSRKEAVELAENLRKKLKESGGPGSEGYYKLKSDADKAAAAAHKAVQAHEAALKENADVTKQEKDWERFSKESEQANQAEVSRLKIDFNPPVTGPVSTAPNGGHANASSGGNAPSSGAGNSGGQYHGVLSKIEQNTSALSGGSGHGHRDSGTGGRAGADMGHNRAQSDAQPGDTHRQHAGELVEGHGAYDAQGHTTGTRHGWHGGSNENPGPGLQALFEAGIGYGKRSDDAMGKGAMAAGGLGGKSWQTTHPETPHHTAAPGADWQAQRDTFEKHTAKIQEAADKMAAAAEKLARHGEDQAKHTEQVAGMQKTAFGSLAAGQGDFARLLGNQARTNQQLGMGVTVAMDSNAALRRRTWREPNQQ